MALVLMTSSRAGVSFAAFFLKEAGARNPRPHCAQRNMTFLRRFFRGKSTSGPIVCTVARLQRAAFTKTLYFKSD
jgi:hypothetical protein